MSTLKDFNFKDKKALIRVDFNVPLDENLNVTDDTRIQSAKKFWKTVEVVFLCRIWVGQKQKKASFH